MRKATLASILRKSRLSVRLNERLEHDCGQTVFQHACKMGLEGIVSKRLGSHYRPGRSPVWLKFKNPDAPAVKREAEGLAMSNRRGQKLGPKRGNRQRFPYEPRVIGGRLLMPAELQAIHRYVVETPVLKTVTEEIRAVVETVWPELRSKLPPKPRDATRGG